jgi:hypothetical protein
MYQLLLHKAHKIILLLLLTIGLVFACGSSKNKKEENVSGNSARKILISIPDTFKPGVLYPKIVINNDELNTFSLYLPKYYNNNSLWPVVFFFDAAGNGSFPVKKYQSLADSLGFIFIGSNVSKNGQQPEESYTIWKSLENVCTQTFSIDKKRIVLAGFSGGARVCCTISANDQSIACIIANSAGAANLSQQLSPNTMFIGMAGKGDMNRAEMLNIEQHLSASTINHFYLEFEGIHEWCPVSTMEKALSLHLMNDYLKNLAQINPVIIASFTLKQNLLINQLKANHNWVQACNELIILIKGTKGLNTSPLESIDSLKNNTEYIIQKEELLRLNATETEIQQQLYNMMLQNIDTLLWSNKMKEIRKIAAGKGNKAAMHQRLLGYASLLCFSFSNRNIMAKNYSEAEKTVACYQLADPKNAEVYFFKAILFGAKADKINTMLNLKKALSLGLTNKSRLMNQSEWIFLKNDSEFQEIVNKGQF